MLSSNLHNLPASRLNLIPVIDNSPRSSSVTTPTNQIDVLDLNAISSSRLLTSTNRSVSQDEIDQDLIDWSVDAELSILNLFDPLKQSNRERNLSSNFNENLSKTPDSTTLNGNKPFSSIASVTSPIKLRLKLTPCSEFKLFNQFVEQIRQSEEVNSLKNSFSNRINLFSISLDEILSVNKT